MSEDKFQKQWYCVHLPAFEGICKQCYFENIAPLQSRISDLEKALDEARKALIAHRTDLHCGSSRPCETCHQSAKALGINVPDRCAQIKTDREALDKINGVVPEAGKG